LYASFLGARPAAFNHDEGEASVAGTRTDSLGEGGKEREGEAELCDCCCCAGSGGGGDEGPDDDSEEARLDAASDDALLPSLRWWLLLVPPANTGSRRMLDVLLGDREDDTRRSILSPRPRSGSPSLELRRMSSTDDDEAAAALLLLLLPAPAPPDPATDDPASGPETPREGEVL
jgi:hypothetical protein